jgi:hypothetical protein
LGSLSWASKKGSKQGGVGRPASRGTAQIAQDEKKLEEESVIDLYYILESAVVKKELQNA